MPAGVKRNPCAKCPFRADVPNYLRRGRRRDIYAATQRGEDFYCHKTVDYSHENDDGETEPDTSAASLCAGAMLLFTRDGYEPAGQLARIAVRLDRGLCDALDACTTPTRSLASWLDGPDDDRNDPDPNLDDEEIDDGRYCNTVDAGCTAPAGWASAGGAIANDDAWAENDCADCGEPVCDACSHPDPDSDSDGVLCGGCAERTALDNHQTPKETHA